MHMQTRTRPGTRKQSRERANAHTQICNIHCFSAEIIIRESASVLHSVYIACLVYLDAQHLVKHSDINQISLTCDEYANKKRFKEVFDFYDMTFRDHCHPRVQVLRFVTLC